MRVLVAVASRHGSTREIGGVIADELRVNGIGADLRDVGEVENIGGYGAVVLGSAIYMGSWMPEAQSFAARLHTELERVPLWVFSSGPLGADDPKPEADLQMLAAPVAGIPLRDNKLFVGRLDPSVLGFAERLAVAVVQAPRGDFRDWEEIRTWARTIASEVAALTPG